MQEKTELLLRIFTEMRGSMFEALWGMYMNKIKNGLKPEDCVYVRMAENKFYESGDYDKLVIILKEIVNGI